MFDINVLGKWCLTGCWVCWVWWGKVLCRLVSSSAYLTLSQCPGHQPEAPHTGAHTACHACTNLSIFYSKFVKFFNRCFHPIVTIFASASCSLIQDEAFHYERILGEEELSLTLDFWWFLFFLIVVFGWVGGVSKGSSKLLMLFPSACLTKHRNPSFAFKFAGFCDVAQFLGWMVSAIWICHSPVVITEARRG